MSQFDQTTEKKSEEYCPDRDVTIPGRGKIHIRHSKREGFEAGRNSTKASLEILARAVEKCANEKFNPVRGAALEAIAQVKANGDWPLGENECQHESYISDRGLPYCKHCHARMVTE